MTRYGIVINPAAGRLSKDKKLAHMKDILPVFGAETVFDGLDTASADEFKTCGRRLAEKVDVIVVAGGDGTFIDIINTVNPGAALAYLPMGTGNALSYSLGMRGSLRENAAR